MWLQLFLLTLGHSFFYIIWRRRRKRMKKDLLDNKEQFFLISFRTDYYHAISTHTYIMTYTKIWDFSSFMQCLKKIHKSIALKLKVMWSFRQVETVYRMHFSLWIDLFFFSAWIILGTLNFEDYWQQCPENDMKKLPLFLQISVSHTHPHAQLSWSF